MPVIAKVPLAPLVVTIPLLVKFDNVAIFCDVLTVTVLVDFVKPVLKVNGTWYAEAAVYAAVPKVPPAALVKLELTTLLASVVPVKVPAAAAPPAGKLVINEPSNAGYLPAAVVCIN